MSRHFQKLNQFTLSKSLVNVLNETLSLNVIKTYYVLFDLTASCKTAKSPRPPKRKRSKDTESGTTIEAADMGKLYL